MYYKCCKIGSHSSATNFGFDKKLKIDFPVCTIYSIRIAICISRTAIYRDAVLVGDTQPYIVLSPRDWLKAADIHIKFTVFLTRHLILLENICAINDLMVNVHPQMN